MSSRTRRRSLKFQALVVATLYTVPTGVVLIAAVAWAAADVPIDVFSVPGAAWTSAGLLAAVLGIVLGKYLPELMRQLALKDTQLIACLADKDKHIADVVAKQEKQISNVVDQFTVTNERQLNQFRETLEIIQAHHAREVAGLGEATNKSMDSIATAVRALETAIAHKAL